MKIKLFITLTSEEDNWDKVTPETISLLRERGLKVEDVPGHTSGGESVLLVSGLPFYPGADTKRRKTGVIVEFMKEASEVFVDYDDYVEAIEQGWLPDEEETYEKLSGEWQEEALYGSYVKEVRPEEIVAIHTYSIAKGDGTPFMVDGKEI